MVLCRPSGTIPAAPRPRALARCPSSGGGVLTRSPGASTAATPRIGVARAPPRMARAPGRTSSTDVQRLQPPAVGGLVELVVKGPHVVRAGGPAPLAAGFRPALAAVLGSPQPLVPPQASGALAVDPGVWKILAGVALSLARVRASVRPQRQLPTVCRRPCCSPGCARRGPAGGRGPSSCGWIGSADTSPRRRSVPRGCQHSLQLVVG